ncbi:noncanonical pyrimidine nucleotidase, YjjG family [Olivibacter sp. SDN3]|uniref:YjjG family noncanonical pyrimidine nucleotidase n=1 Tax=Olivibacter sp. SDN3 TaxID=2764720 RepID=UPI00165118D7|nr:YjjG family noncanonical pyrimidine nucleotidase [Olivibacter sp. SDN3]QNL50677.1 noncanonical pyrimidine nucleotidase, YjjG family [Olivibacter sp. SDN3]
MQYTHKKHIFFDLDHTLWDFDKNAEETLSELFTVYKFPDLGINSADKFIETYHRNNQRVWALYHNGVIDKDELRRARFADTFSELGISPTLFPEAFETDYLRLCPHKTNLFPGVHDTLAYLRENYVLHLISNGFKDAAAIKIVKTGIKKYFSQIIISEDVGVHKPHPAIYSHSLVAAQANKEESVMIGDSIEADIRGAQAFGLDAIYFNPNGLEEPADVKKSIRELAELTRLF